MSSPGVKRRHLGECCTVLADHLHRLPLIGSRAIAELPITVVAPTPHTLIANRTTMQLAYADKRCAGEHLTIAFFDLDCSGPIRDGVIADLTIAVVAPTPHIATTDRTSMIAPGADTSDIDERCAVVFLGAHSADTVGSTAVAELAIAVVAPTPHFSVFDETAELSARTNGLKTRRMCGAGHYDNRLHDDAYAEYDCMT
jgi:hypothetical protein